METCHASSRFDKTGKNFLKPPPMTSYKIALLPPLAVIALALPSFSSAKQGPKPGRYSGVLGENGRISFKIDRSGRFISQVRVIYSKTYVDSRGYSSSPVTMDFNGGSNRQRVRVRNRFAFSKPLEGGHRYNIRARGRGKKKYDVTLVIYRVNSLQFYNPVTEEYDRFMSNSADIVRLQTIARR